MNDLVKLLSNTDYDVQQYIGDILKPIREQQRKDAHKKMFANVLDDIWEIGECYEELTSERIHITKDDSVIDMLINLDYYTEGTDWEENNWSHELFVHRVRSFASHPNWNQ
jgi:hypothetical protein